MLKEYLFKKALDLAFERARIYLAEAQSSLLSNPTTVEAALDLHLNTVRRWSEEVQIADSKAAKRTRSIYVHLDAFVYPRRMRVEPTERIESISLDAALEHSKEHIVLLGQPGAGKSTSMKYVSQRLLTDENFLADRAAFPLLLRMQDLNTTLAKQQTPKGEILCDRVIFAAFANLFGLTFRFAQKPVKKEQQNEAAGLAEGVIMTFLEELRPLIIIEGFDELASHELREIALREIRALARQLSKARIVITSRTGEFPFHVENCSHFEICPLTREQITEFAKKWLESSANADRFIKEIGLSPFADTAIKPLTLAHLCAIYERIGKIPDKPKTVYRKVVSLLLEEWDEQRSVRRISRYGEFSSDRKFEFLAHLSYELSLETSVNKFDLRMLSRIYARICGNFGLTGSEAKNVLAELETHTGLFVQAGFESYEFAHRSLREYLTAEYIVRLPTLLRSPELIEKLANELAIAITISSNPSSYLTELVLSVLVNNAFTPEFYATFVTRLLQEKPDFNLHEDVALALITLYSLYLDNSLAGSHGGQLNLILMDSLTQQFEDLMKRVSQRNLPALTRKLYAEEGVRQASDGTEIVILRRRREFGDPRLPESVYARRRFLG